MQGVSHQSEPGQQLPHPPPAATSDQLLLKERTPSYCDRILWKSTEACEGNAVQQLLASADQVSSSDHKPVYAHFVPALTTC